MPRLIVVGGTHIFSVLVRGVAIFNYLDEIGGRGENEAGSMVRRQPMMAVMPHVALPRQRRYKTVVHIPLFFDLVL